MTMPMAMTTMAADSALPSSTVSPSSFFLPPPGPVGVIGGGQLGRMFAHAAQRMGYQVIALTDRPHDPAVGLSNETVLGGSGDPETLKRFADKVKAATIEFENVSAEGMRWLEDQGVIVRPSWRTVRICQDRIREKTFLARFGVPVAPWLAIESAQDASRAAETLRFPVILKTASSGYDGKGQIRANRPEDLAPSWDRLGHAPCVVEQVVDFVAELSVIAARDAEGRASAYPASLNDHKRHILDSAVCPAPVGPVLFREARELALRIIHAMDDSGLLTVEMFLTSDGQILVNELAPRPHNSGHHTIEAGLCSQFQQQLRILCGLPLGSGDLISPAAMVNLLGDLWSEGEPDWRAALSSDPGVRLHLYGKLTPKPGRKMGHLTVLDPDPENALIRALAARGRLVNRPAVSALKTNDLS